MAGLVSSDTSDPAVWARYAAVRLSLAWDFGTVVAFVRMQVLKECVALRASVAFSRKLLSRDVWRFYSLENGQSRLTIL